MIQRSFVGDVASWLTRRCLLPVVLSLAASSALAGDREFSTVDAFLATLPKEHEKRVVEGDLNGDRLGDRAVIEVSRSSDNASGNEETLKIYVLLQKQGGGYDLAAMSKVGAVEPRYKFFREIRIEKGSLYLEFEGGMRPLWQRFQFKLYKGSWRLIGFTTSVPTPYRTLRDGGSASDGSDLNLLTGDAVTISDEGTSEQKMVRSKLSVRPCFLADFNFDDDFIEKFCRK